MVINDKIVPTETGAIERQQGGHGVTVVVRDGAGVVRLALQLAPSHLTELMMTGATLVQFHITDVTRVPMKALVKTELIEVPVLPPASALRDKMVAEVMAPYTRDGWTGNTADLDDKTRVRRALPGGHTIYEVRFVKHVPDEEAATMRGED